MTRHVRPTFRRRLRTVLAWQLAAMIATVFAERLKHAA